ncbi:MAG: hypothetical protein [Caudoviricetes sp.]|nr:MAG: hypothetical protein [Caudoviricetes sp.]
MKEIKQKIKDCIFTEFNQELIGDKVKLQNKVNKLQRMIEMINYLQPIEEKDNFVLPEKWCVLDNKTVSKWAGKIFGCSTTCHGNKYLNVKNLKDIQQDYWFDDYIYDGHTEITFEQFKKYVQNEK